MTGYISKKAMANDKVSTLITQFARQSHLDVYGLGLDKAKWELALERYTRLVVQDCINVVDKIVPPGYNDYPDYRDQIEAAFRSECAVEIKKHFKVIE